MTYFIVLAVVVLVLFLLGPRVEVNTAVSPPQLPDDLDAYLSTAEARFSDIVPGAEKTIVWAGEPGGKTPLSLVYLHGFSATRQETAPLAEEVAARLGANLFCTRYTGHGRTGTAMGQASVNDWLNDTWEAFEIGKRIGEKVVVMGVSTGGSAAVWLAAQPNVPELAALVLVSPNFGPKDGKAEILLWPWAEKIASALMGEELNWESVNEAHGRYWTLHYPTRATLPMMGLVKLARQVKPDAISAPVLVIYSPDDEVVNPRRTEAFYNRLAVDKKALVAVPDPADPYHHVLAGDILGAKNTPFVREQVVAFLEQAGLGGGD